MKKLILATLLGGIGIASAQAQSNVTIYGTVDVGVVSEHGGAAEFEIAIEGKIFHRGWTLTLTGRIDQLVRPAPPPRPGSPA